MGIWAQRAAGESKEVLLKFGVGSSRTRHFQGQTDTLFFRRFHELDREHAKSICSHRDPFMPLPTRIIGPAYPRPCTRLTPSYAVPNPDHVHRSRVNKFAVAYLHFSPNSPRISASVILEYFVLTHAYRFSGHCRLERYGWLHLRRFFSRLIYPSRISGFNWYLLSPAHANSATGLDLMGEVTLFTYVFQREKMCF